VEEFVPVKLLPIVVCLSLTPGLPGQPAHPLEPSASSANVKVRLLSEVLAIQPGRTFMVALRMTMAPSWHTYWKNPGDSGMATRTVWTLPDGFKASELQWPIPSRAVDGRLSRYGYEREATFLAAITPGPDLPKGRFSVAAKVSWLECRDICIPGKASLEISLPSSAPAPKAALDPAVRTVFAAARASIPRASADLRMSHSVEGARLVLRIVGPAPRLGEPLEFFPETAGLIEAAEPQDVSREGAGWAISLKRAANPAATPPVLRGVLVTSLRSRRMAWDISSAAAEGRPGSDRPGHNRKEIP
jgi:thiol:disulfide interchange protein DsbD